VVYHVAAGLSPEQFEITVACAPGGELVQWLRELPQKVRVIEIPELKRNISPLKDLKAFWKLYTLIKKKGFDIVHCHSTKAGVLGRLAARLVGVPKIFFTVHGWGINKYQSWPVRFAKRRPTVVPATGNCTWMGWKNFCLDFGYKPANTGWKQMTRDGNQFARFVKTVAPLSFTTPGVFPGIWGVSLNMRQGYNRRNMWK